MVRKNHFLSLISFYIYITRDKKEAEENFYYQISFVKLFENKQASFDTTIAPLLSFSSSLSHRERREYKQAIHHTHRRAFLWPSIPYEESTTNVEKKDPTNPSISSQIHLCLNPNFHPSFRSYVTFHLSRGKKESRFPFRSSHSAFPFFPARLARRSRADSINKQDNHLLSR